MNMEQKKENNKVPYYKKSSSIYLFKLMDSNEEIKVQCECSCKNIMPVWVHYRICKWCGRKIHNNTLAYFRYQYMLAKEHLEYDIKNEI